MRLGKHELLILVLQRLPTPRALQGSSPTLKKNVRGNGHSSIPVARESFRLHLSRLTRVRALIRLRRKVHDLDNMRF